MKEAYRDLEPFSYLWLSGVVVVLASMCVSALVLGICGFVRRWKWYANWSLVATTVLTGVVTFRIVANPHRLLGANELPYLKTPPVTADLVGIYQLDASSYSKASSFGYSELTTAVIILKSDGKFETTAMPPNWMSRQSWKGYDSRRGTWKVVRERSIYKVEFQAAHIAPNSPRPPDTYSQSIIAGIAAKTKTRHDYVLAVPPGDDDDGHLIFNQQKPDAR